MVREAVEVFVSYSRQDEDLRTQLTAHLKSLERQGVISSWHDGKIVPGSEWQKNIETYLERADIILLLVSANFLASDFCWNVEIAKALERHQKGEAVVVPVILRPVDWSYTPLKRLQALPENAKPVVTWDSPDLAFMDIAEGIKEHANQIIETRQKKEENQKKQVAFSKYRQQLKKYLADGKISFIERESLKVLSDSLNLSDSETSRIEAEELAAVRTYESNLEKYRKTFRQVIRDESILSSRTKKSLKEYQNLLNLKDQDIEYEEEKIRKEYLSFKQEENPVRAVKAQENAAMPIAKNTRNARPFLSTSLSSSVNTTSTLTNSQHKRIYTSTRERLYKLYKRITIYGIFFGVFFLALWMIRPIVFIFFSTDSDPKIEKTLEGFPENFSSGERFLASDGVPNAALQRGQEAFAASNYMEAINFFEQVTESDQRNPEAQIYLSNAQARQVGSPLKVAVVVPISGGINTAKEMLRGVADAQVSFNEAGGIDNQLLEVVIADDANDPDRARIVAKNLSQREDILGVIGHNSSEASAAALPTYEKAGLAMVAPTSTDTSLSSDVFFRTVFSNEVAGKALANHAVNSGIDNVFLLYASQSNYSISMEKSFTKHFNQLSGSITKRIDLTQRDTNLEDIEEKIQNLPEEVNGLILLPDKNTVSTVISVAQTTSNLRSRRRIQLLGGDTLYDPDTLTVGGGAIEGLILVVPWFPNTAYAERADNRWGGRVSWRTATSYDAALALIDAISIEPSREGAIQKLKSVSISSDKTSGSKMEFLSSGELVVEPLLVEVVEGSGGPAGSAFTFQLLE